MKPKLTVPMFLAALALSPLPTHAAEIPDATQKILKELKLDAALLDGLDAELAVPKAWLEAAEKEGPVGIYTTMKAKAWNKVEAVWKERYPNIELNHQTVRNAPRRWVQPLAAFKEGRHVTDVIASISGKVYLFRQAKAFEDLSDLPAYRLSVPKASRQPDHITAPMRSRYWCICYNTTKIKAEDLPKTWDDLIGNKAFANKRLGLVNRSNLWLNNIWSEKGDEWGNRFTEGLFALDPQLRKEGLTAVLNLVAIGEMDAVIPAAMNRVGPLSKKGAPVGFHCPEPVPLSTTNIGILRGSPHVNGAKVFLNWLLSREGQMAQFSANASPPAHDELRKNRGFYPYFADSVIGKETVVVNPHTDLAVSKTVGKVWDKYWQQGGGQ